MRADLGQLVKEASAILKSDAKGAVAKLESAYALACEAGVASETASVAEELSRGWARRRSAAKSLYYATKATELAPDSKSAWTTLAKTCELVGVRTDAPTKRRRAQALFRGAASAFKRAAALAKDPEDKRWLLELARDASRQAKPTG